MTGPAPAFARTPPARLAAAHVLVSVAAFAVASIMGVLQGLSIADFEFPLRSESLYYLSVTAHGVLMALGRTYVKAGRKDEAARAFSRIADEFPGEYAELKHDFNATMESLEETIRTVNHSVVNI